jgi:uncharacterized protein
MDSQQQQNGTAAAPAIEPMPAAAATDSAPVSGTERITAIDTLRGFALLGILLMNIVPMGMYGGAYDNPTVTGGATGWNLGVWAALHVLAEGKMRCLFSLVFGGSMILLTSRLEKRGNAADIYYRRTLWMVGFGVVHAYLLWAGDILYPYALCALALYPFRNMAARKLITIGSVVLALTSLAYIGKGFGEREMLTKGQAAIATEKSGNVLTDDQKKEKEAYEHWQKLNRPTAEALKKDMAEWQGNPGSVLKVRARFVWMFHAKPYYFPLFWDIWSMMFIGMGLMKLGVLSAERSMGTYAKMTAAGYLVGIPLNIFTAWTVIQSNFDPVVQSFTHLGYDVGRLSVALGHLGVIMLLCKSGAIGWLTGSLGVVGQMALSNYVLQSVIGVIVFTGFGFKLYGTLERHQLYYVVAGVWILQLIISPIWLRHFRFGPLEWCWRSLTYGKRQPMRLA